MRPPKRIHLRHVIFPLKEKTCGLSFARLTKLNAINRRYILFGGKRIAMR